MPCRLRRTFAAALLGLVAARAPAQPVTYDRIAPILAGRCVICHAGASAAADLQLDSFDGLLKGSRNGPVVRRGEPDASELLRRLRGTAQPRMPMTGPPFLADDEIALVERWIAAGLLPGATLAAQPPTTRQQAPPAVPTYADVAPIFARRCAKCHADNGLMGAPPEGYRLNAYAATIASTDRLRVVPGSPAASELVRRIVGTARPRMPLDGPPYLSDAEIAQVTAWVEHGARDTAGNPAPPPAGARVRLHGTLQAAQRLDDLDLRLAPGSRADRSAVGAYVEVRGRVTDDGAIAAERIRRR